MLIAHLISTSLRRKFRIRVRARNGGHALENNHSNSRDLKKASSKYSGFPPSYKQVQIIDTRVYGTVAWRLTAPRGLRCICIFELRRLLSRCTRLHHHSSFDWSCEDRKHEERNTIDSLDSFFLGEYYETSDAT